MQKFIPSPTYTNDQDKNKPDDGYLLLITKPDYDKSKQCKITNNNKCHGRNASQKTRFVLSELIGIK